MCVRRCILVLAVFAAMGCSDDPVSPPRDPMNIFVGLDNTFEEALAMAAPGDTIVVQVGVALSAGVEIASNKTPLVIRGDRKDISFSGPGSGTLLTFVDPKDGTRVSNIDFKKAARYVRARGSGAIAVDACTFAGGETQIRIEDEVAATVSTCVMSDPSLFNIDVEGGSTLIAVQNTLHGAGDCGVRLLDFTRMHAEQNIVTEYKNYGIACVSGVLLAESKCNDVFDSDPTTADPLRSSEPYLGCEPAAGDFSKDPKFCDLEGRDFQLFDTSPCAEANSEGCGQVGALPVGCLAL